MLKINSFSITREKKKTVENIWRDIAAFQDFKVTSRTCEDFARVHRDRKLKLKKKCKFKFRLNCKQRLQGLIIDTVTCQVYVFRWCTVLFVSTNCRLFLRNNSARRTVFSTVSKTQFGVKTYIELKIISLVFLTIIKILLKLGDTWKYVNAGRFEKD